MSSLPLNEINQIPLTCRGHTRPITHVHYGRMVPDGLFFISSSLDTTPMLRNGENGDWIGTFIGHSGAVYGCSLDPEVSHAATGSADYTIKYWDAITGDMICSVEEEGIIRSVDFNPTGKKIGGCGVIPYVTVVNCETSAMDKLHFASPQNGDKKLVALSLGYISENEVLVGISSGQLITLDERVGKEVAVYNLGDRFTCFELSEEQKTLSVCTELGVSFLALKSGRFEELKRFRIPDVISCSIHPERKSFVVGGKSMLLRIHSYNDGEEIETLRAHHGGITAVRFDPTGKTYASGSEDGTVRIWDTYPNHFEDVSSNSKAKLSPSSPSFVPSYYN